MTEQDEVTGDESSGAVEDTTTGGDNRTERDGDESSEEPVTVAFEDDPSEGRDVLSGDLRYETTPMLRPVVVMLATVLVGGSVAMAIPLLRPDLFGDPVLAEIVLYAVAVLVTVTVVRYAIRLVVLARTRYEIREDALVRRYSLAYKRTVRKIPISKLRGHEFTQSRYQAWLDVGTIRLLTAGTNRSLGFLAFEHLKDPKVVEREIQTLLVERETEE
ncbi:PH domain-containing protein [Natronobacterium texcoconense]|uniref:PH domain-containing protein n=1 Tax=Natronobacterium texcoconense TaxID=1095778 RepID=A0A1H1HNU8_NATTX|nr:PH domain-containing protein [Natronobacterium texcoconense]SDR27029.1 PH domain-containing protein [Natronobacterium texcoconense]